MYTKIEWTHGFPYGRSKTTIEQKSAQEMASPQKAKQANRLQVPEDLGEDVERDFTQRSGRIVYLRPDHWKRFIGFYF
jgi:hypothetical protein